MKYHVREPLSAVLKEPAGSVAFMTVDSGSVITTKGDAHTFGFVEANYGGEEVLVFMQDLELRADRVRGTSDLYEDLTREFSGFLKTDEENT